MPSLTDAEVERLTHKIDIHGLRTGDDEKAAGGSGPEPSPDLSNPTTRVPSPSFGDVVKADRER